MDNSLDLSFAKALKDLESTWAGQREKH